MSDTRFYDSQLAFQGGMQGGFDPGHVADDQFFRGVNVSIREGIITCRPSFNEINLDFSGLEFNENTLAAAQAAYDAAYQTSFISYLTPNPEGNLMSLC